MNNWPIRWKLTFWNTLVLILLLASFAGAMLIMLRQHLYERDDIVIAEELNELVDELRRCSNKSELIRQLEQRFSHHSHYHFQLVQADATVLFRSSFLQTLRLPLPADPGKLRGPVFQYIALPGLGHFRLLTQSIHDPHGRLLIVQVVTSRATLNRQFQSYLWITMFLLPVGAIAAFVSGWLLARWALAPINRIIGIAEKISVDVLSERLEVGNAQDELGRLANTLNSMFDRLRSSIDEMRRFSADAAHELRSPLAVMRTEAEVVLMSARSVNRYQQALQVNLQETQRLSELVDQLLMLSRHDAGLSSELQEDVQLNALIRDVSDRFETAAMEKGIRLEVNCDQPCVVVGDDIALSQLFFNLMDNAIKYTPPDKSVRLSLEVEGALARVILDDTGIGIPREYLPRIFDRFYRVDYSRSRESGGSGLGLAICKSIVEAHQGAISVQSEPGGGTQFVVSFACRPLEHNSTGEEPE